MRSNRILWMAVWAMFGVLTACSGGGQQTTTTNTNEEPEAPAGTTLIRFVHAVPDGGAGDLVVADTTVASNREFGTWGEWVEVPAGEQDIALRSGEMVELTDHFEFNPNKHYWIIAYGMFTPQGNEASASFLIQEEESLGNDPDQETWIRFGNMVVDGSEYGLAITTGDGFRGIFPNQPVGTMSEFKLGPVDENSFVVFPSDDPHSAELATFEENLPLGLLYTFVAVGTTDDIRILQISESAER